MKSAKELTEFGDLVAISGSYSGKLFPGVIKKWTENSLQYFLIKDDDFYNLSYGSYYDDVDSIDDYFDKVDNPGSSYIHGKYFEKRVVPINEDQLEMGEKKYYNKLMEILT